MPSNHIYQFVKNSVNLNANNTNEILKILVFYEINKMLKRIEVHRDTRHIKNIPFQYPLLRHR